MHTPKYREQASDMLVVFIHGFIGSPAQFDDLADAVYQNGASVLSLLLPGHGGAARDFAAHGYADWEAHVQSELEKYAGQYEKIYLAGHSMGCLLALNVCAAAKYKLAGLFLTFTPLKINYLNPRALFTRLRFLTYGRGHPVKSAYYNALSITAPSFWHYLYYVKPSIEFLRLAAKTKRILRDVTAPVVSIHSKRDETVAFSSARAVYDGLINAEKQRIILQKSLHAYYTEDEREIIRDALLKLINHKEAATP
ncbi:MAG: alpha/beta fold hydrolase [Oscillospiraceae bacterium]|nr:alpha/beta fold hydrolase [Oscillospiraceae bacterium]